MEAFANNLEKANALDTSDQISWERSNTDR
jgi:hypothetical protein